ncbi:MAG: HAMP domain-containing histidine kinase [Porphyrobacter sp.]|nr:HAMP domain-containing histidine kinase [Porphyrobacter sp.]
MRGRLNLADKGPGPSSETKPVTQPSCAADRLPGLAHELANLVQAVSGNLELLGRRSLDETSLRYLGNAQMAAQHLTELTIGLQATLPSSLRSRK